MSDPFAAFAGLDKAKAQGGRLPKPALGKAAYLVESIRTKDNERSSGFRTEIIATCLWGIDKGKTHDGQEVAGESVGQKVSHCFFGDTGNKLARYQQDFKSLCLVILGMQESQELEIADQLKVQGADELARIQQLWTRQLPGLVCAIDPVSGEPTAAGIFDGRAIIELSTSQTKVFKKADKNKPAGEGNMVYDQGGDALSDVYTNTYINNAFTLGVAQEKLSEAEICKFFGSVDRFNQIKAELA